MQPRAPASLRMPEFRGANHSRAWRRLAVFPVILWCAIGCDAGSAGEIDPHDPTAIVAALAREDLDVRRGFAELALQSLVEEYRGELALAAREARGGWRAGAAGFVAGLGTVLARVGTAAEIELAQEAHGAIRIGVDGDQIMLTVPRPARQAVFDRELFARFCLVWPCPERPSARSVVADTVAQRVPTEWLFSDRGPPVLSAPDGLACVFDDTRHLQLKRRACERIMNELRKVADLLRAVTEAGQGLDWPALAVTPDAATDLPRLIYDARGGYHHADLPILAHAPDLLRDATPWLQARLRGHVGYSMIRPPARIAYQE